MSGEGRVGSKRLKDGQAGDFRLTRESALVISQLHGTTFEQQVRNAVFLGYNSGTISTFLDMGLYNPVGSGVLITPIRYELVITTVPATLNPGFPVFWMGVTTRENIQDGYPVLADVSTSIIALPVGSNNLPTGRMISDSSINYGGFAQGPVIFRQLGMWFEGATTTSPYVPTFCLNFQGTCVLAPGSQLVAQCNNYTTVPSGSEIWIWEEIPISSSSEFAAPGPQF